MNEYYVNDTAQLLSGDNEVHKDTCPYFNSIKYKTYLGTFNSCHLAVSEAKRKYPTTADGCATCCPECHTS